MRAGFSFSYPSISLLLGQPLSIKKSYAGAIQYGEDKNKICTGPTIEQPRQDKNLLYRHDKPNKPTKEGTL
jgi:hypothetical protein